jgi:nucleotide-binding universal stress UspA family protein
VTYHEHVQVAEEDARLALETALSDVRKEFSDVSVDLQLTEQSPAKELVLYSRIASVLVVGSRGSGGFAGMRLGSTARTFVPDRRTVRYWSGSSAPLPQSELGARASRAPPT